MRIGEATKAAAVVIGAIVVQIGVVSTATSHYALTHWWVPKDLNAVVLVATVIIAAAASTVLGYLTRRIWPAVIQPVVIVALRVLALRRPALLMQGFEFPAALATALLFGWIGSRLRLGPR